MSESRNYKKWQTSVIIREISDSKSGDQEKRFKIWSLPDYAGELTALQRKHLAFHDATTVVSLSNDCRYSLLMTCYYPGLGSDASSVWNFCARFSGVILRGNQSGSSAN